MPKKVIITKENSLGKEECWTEFFECPNCKGHDIHRGDHYCSNCGVKVEFNMDDKDYA